MIDGWEERTIGELVTINARSIGSGYPYERIVYLDTGSVTRGVLDAPVEMALREAPSRARRLVKHNSILYSCVRPIQRHYGIVVDPADNLVVSTGFAVIDVDNDQADPRFVYALLTSDQMVEAFDVIADASTSAYPAMKPDDIAVQVIDLPPLGEQKAIAEVLSSLDDKIALLHRQNATLEALAETVFRQHFIEEAQDNWESGILDDVLTVKGGTTPSTNNSAFWDGDIHWTSPKDLSANNGLFLLDTARKITPEGLKQIGSGLLPAGSLLMSSRAPVGYMAFSVNPVAINQGYIGILDDKGFSKEFIFLWLKTNMEYVKGHANGSTFQEISKSTFKKLEITKPPEQLRQEFQGLVAPLFEKLLKNTLQCQKLQQLRNTLLPKLMSGQVRIDVSA